MDKAKRSILKMKRFWLGLFLLSCLAALASCAGPRALMQTAPEMPKGEAAYPAIDASSLSLWKTRRARTLDALETHIYGHAPRGGGPQDIRSRIIAGHTFENAEIEERILSFMVTDGNFVTVPLVTLVPKDQDGPVPLIIMQNFCPNHNVIPIEGLTKPEGDFFDCGGGGLLSGVFTYFFGRHITTPPIDMILSRGYAIAVIYPPQLVPDNAQGAQRAFETFGTQDWGAIGAWAWQAAGLANLLHEDERFSHRIAYGHSRYGKSALLAAAYMGSIDGVIAHQSGTGGASLSRNKKGETVAAITEGYPHWFTPQYASYGADQSGLPVDQHHLLALIAPRPVLLGNARRDVWSDPEGAFRAARGATPIYELYGKSGLGAQKLTQFQPSDSLAFWMRPGTHGVTKADWEAFLIFLDAHFK